LPDFADIVINPHFFPDRFCDNEIRPFKPFSFR